MIAVQEPAPQTRKLRVCIVNGVFVSAGMGDDGRVRPASLYFRLAAAITQATGWRAWPLWAYASLPEYGYRHFVLTTRRTLSGYAGYLAACIREDLSRQPLDPDEALAFVAYSGGVPVVQTAATLLRPQYPVRAFAFIGPALRPRIIPRNWRGDATVGCILGTQDWMMGVYPRLPRPWSGGCTETDRARITVNLPPDTRYRHLPCDHWPGYFQDDHWPSLVTALCAVLQPAAAPAPSPVSR